MKVFIPNVMNKKRKSIKPRLPTIQESYAQEDYWSDECGDHLQNKKEELKLSIKNENHFDYKPEYEFTTEKIDGKNVRTWMNERKGDFKQPKLVLSFNINCQHRWIFDVELGEYICNKCLKIEQKIENRDETFNNKNLNVRIWVREHDRNRWTRDELEYCNGKYNDKIGDQFWFHLLTLIPTPFTWYQVYKTFQKFELKKLWLGFGMFIGLKIKISPQIVKKADRYTNYKMCENYRIPYLYLIYKFTQIHGEKDAEKTIPLKASKNWLKKADEWWLELCKNENIVYLPSDICVIHWDKQRQIYKFSKYLRSAGLGKI